MTDPNAISAFDGMADPKPKRGGKRSRNKGLRGDREIVNLEHERQKTTARLMREVRAHGCRLPRKHQRTLAAIVRPGR